MKNTFRLFPLFVFILIMGMGCSDNAIPKPRGYYRIDLPKKSYTNIQTPCDVRFDVPNYSKLELMKTDHGTDSCWFNLSFPKFNAKLYCTYIPIHSDFEGLIRDSYNFAARHEMKASALKRTLINDSERKVFGILYDIEGDAASQLQFFVSDSTSHFFRGSLYFYNTPNADSIAPVLNFLREDILRLTETLEWSKPSGLSI